MNTDPVSPNQSDTPEKDPRLEIPEILRTPVRQSQYDPVSGNKADKYPTVDTSAMGRAWGLAFDFIITTLVGAGLGWALDYWLGWSPIGMLVGLTLGFVAAMVRMVRQAGKMGRSAARTRPPKSP